MKKFTVLFLSAWLVTLALTLRAQNPVVQEVLSRQLTRESFTPGGDLFRQASARENAVLRQSMPGATKLTLQPQVLNDLLTENHPNLELTIPAAEGDRVLQLYEVNILSEGFGITTSDGRSFTAHGGRHYRGIVNGDRGSLAAISIFEDEVMGLVVDNAGNNVLGRIGGEGDAYVFYNDKDMPDIASFQCHTTDAHNIAEPKRGMGSGRIAATSCVRVYWEADYDLYTDKGSSVTDVVNYLTGLFNQSKLIYDSDGISVTLQEIFVWTGTSPYSGNSGDKLGQFRTYRTSFNGDLAHLMHLGGGGGIAYVNTLCAAGWNYGVSGIYASYNNYPVYSWSVMVVTHEQGHIMGSPHTHDCVWNGDNTAIDNCGGSDCTSLEGSSPAGGGTIMSYCHLTGTGINLSKGFGPQPKALIQSTINAKSCLGSGCDTTYVALVDNAVYNLVAAHSQKLMDVSGGSTADGGNVIQWSANGGANQQWRAVSVGGGYWRFENINSGKALSVKDSSAGNSANIHQWSWVGSDNQQWDLLKAGGGYFYMVNKSSGKGIDVAGVSTADGANLHQYDLWYGDNQRWRFDVLPGAAPAAAASEETAGTGLVLAPNPARAELSITFRAEADKMTDLMIYDLRGLAAYTEKVPVVKGMNTLRTEAIAHLAPGLYVVAVEGKKAKLIVEK